jgi:hypothetical protein
MPSSGAPSTSTPSTTWALMHDMDTLQDKWLPTVPEQPEIAQ